MKKMVMKGISKIFGGRRRGRLARQWEFQADSQILGSPAVGEFDDGRKAIIFGTKDGHVYTLDEQSKLRWKYELKEKRTEEELLFLDEESIKSIRGQPTLADLNSDCKMEIIVGSDNGNLSVLSEKGKLLWEYKTGSPIRSSAVVADINFDSRLEIIFGCDNSRLYALDNEGALLWTFNTKSPIESMPMILKKDQLQIIFGTNDGTIYSVGEKGTEIWKFKTGAKVTAQPIAADLKSDGKTSIIVGSHDNNLYALDERGILLWKFSTDGSIHSKVCIADINNDSMQEVIFGSCDNSIYALTAEGVKIWSYETDFWVVASPYVMDFDNDGKPEVIAGSYDNSLYVLDAEGSYILNYMPGISGITQQSGHYSSVMTSQPGNYQGKKLWEYKTDSFIVGSAYIDDKSGKKIVVGTKSGNLDLFTHQD